MLTKRTQILFDENLWRRLSRAAKEKDVSVGEIVRNAVEEKFLEQEKLEKRQKAVDSTLKHRPKPFKGRIDYKALINEGRKAY